MRSRVLVVVALVVALVIMPTLPKCSSLHLLMLERTSLETRYDARRGEHMG